MKASLSAAALIAAIFLSPLAAHAEGGRGRSGSPVRRPGTTPFRVSFSAYMPKVSITAVRPSGGLMLVDVSYKVSRGYISSVELWLDDKKMADIEVPGSSKGGSMTAKLASGAMAKGEHTLVARAAQGRPGHQSKKRSSKAVKFTR
jgi:hypothetical protein